MLDGETFPRAAKAVPTHATEFREGLKSLVKLHIIKQGVRWCDVVECLCRSSKISHLNRIVLHDAALGTVFVYPFFCLLFSLHPSS